MKSVHFLTSRIFHIRSTTAYEENTCMVLQDIPRPEVHSVSSYKYHEYSSSTCYIVNIPINTVDQSSVRLSVDVANAVGQRQTMFVEVNTVALIEAHL